LLRQVRALVHPLLVVVATRPLEQRLPLDYQALTGDPTTTPMMLELDAV
jgi:hypothetical protein